MLGELQQVVLLAALRLAEGRAVSIHDEVCRGARRELTLGTVYKTLTRLEAKGYVASRLGDAEARRGRRATRRYRVTSSGRRQLEASLAVIRRMADGLAVGAQP
jgi:PadR family transcriptional regulator, regulatory protein PadR